MKHSEAANIEHQGDLAYHRGESLESNPYGHENAGFPNHIAYRWAFGWEQAYHTDHSARYARNHSMFQSWLEVAR